MTAPQPPLAFDDTDNVSAYETLLSLRPVRADLAQALKQATGALAMLLSFAPIADKLHQGLKQATGALAQFDYELSELDRAADAEVKDAAHEMAHTHTVREMAQRWEARGDADATPATLRARAAFLRSNGVSDASQTMAQRWEALADAKEAATPPASPPAPSIRATQSAYRAMKAVGVVGHNGTLMTTDQANAATVAEAPPPTPRRTPLRQPRSVASVEAALTKARADHAADRAKLDAVAPSRDVIAAECYRTGFRLTADAEHSDRVRWRHAVAVGSHVRDLAAELTEHVRLGDWWSLAARLRALPDAVRCADGTLIVPDLARHPTPANVLPLHRAAGGAP